MENKQTIATESKENTKKISRLHEDLNLFINALCLGVFLFLPSLDGLRLGPLLQHTHDGLVKDRPSWSPDGKRMTFARHEVDGSHIWQYVLDVDNPASLRRLTDRKM